MLATWGLNGELLFWPDERAGRLEAIWERLVGSGLATVP